MPFGPRNVAGVLASLSYAGPSASRVGASAVVARLRRSVAWSDRRLAELSTLPEASAKVAGSPTLVVDRRGLIRSVGSLLESFEDTRTPKVLAAEAVILRALAKDATGIWDVRSGPPTCSRTRSATPWIRRTGAAGCPCARDCAASTSPTPPTSSRTSQT